MSNLQSFAEVMRLASEDKKRRSAEEDLRRKTEVAPLLSELFAAVSKAKTPNNLTPTPTPAPIEAVLALPVEKISELVQSVEKKATTILAKVAPDAQEKRFLALFKRLQDDFQTLKGYVESKSSSYSGGMTSGSGEVRILRMDDVVHTNPVHGSTIVWDDAIKKFNFVIPTTNLEPVESGEEMPYAKRIDFINDNELYKGEAVVGALVTLSVWRIRKIVISDDGDVSETWADGNANYDNSWANRLTYTYS